MATVYRRSSTETIRCVLCHIRVFIGNNLQVGCGVGCRRTLSNRNSYLLCSVPCMYMRIFNWQQKFKGAVWTVAGRPPSALFKVLVLGDNGVGKTALARALCGKGFLPEYTPDTAVSVTARSFSRDGYPPAVLEVSPDRSPAVDRMNQKNTLGDESDVSGPFKCSSTSEFG